MAGQLATLNSVFFVSKFLGHYKELSDPAESQISKQPWYPHTYKIGLVLKEVQLLLKAFLNTYSFDS